MKNVVTVSITALGTDGEGIGALSSGKKIFIPGALPGEEAEAEITEERSRFARGKLLKIIRASEDRTQEDPIPGANLIHLDYQKQLEYKKDKVRSCLIKIGGFKEEEADSILNDTVPSGRELHYRNHTQYKIDENTICFSEEGTGEAVKIAVSPLEYEVFSKIRLEMESIFKDAPQRLFSGLVLRGSERTKELLIEFVTDMEGSHETIIRDAGDYIGRTDMEKKLENATEGYEIKGILLRISPTRTDRRTRSGKRVVLTGTDSYREKLCGREFLIKSGAFFQVNTDQAEKLYGEAAKGTESAKTIWDLYCGTGSVGLSVVREGQELTGIEVSGEAVESAKINAGLSGIKNARFLLRDLTRTDISKEGLPSPDAVIIDPPRKGSDERTIRNIIAAGPETIVYISCDPATLARDLKQFRGSYDVKSVTPVDMFPQTSHVETVVLLSKENMSTKHVRVEFNVEEMDMSDFKVGATYDEITNWIYERYGFKVSHLNIAQTKRKCGITERENYNFPKSDNSVQPNTPPEKEAAIIEAFKHFKMI